LEGKVLLLTLINIQIH